MISRPIFPALRSWLWALALLLPAIPGRAEPIRVTTWDLPPGALARTAAETLQKLRPDVILLQQVSNWEFCQQLARALQPEIYHVAICSAFGDAGAKPAGGQVAILAKPKAYLAWSEPWTGGGSSPGTPRGFAFAAVEWEGRNIGFFCVQLGQGDASQPARQLVKQIDSLQNWSANRLQSLVVAGDFATPPDGLHLQQLGLDDAFAGAPLKNRITLPGASGRPAATMDHIFTRNAGRVGSPTLTQTAISEHAAVTCEMDLTAPKAPAPAMAELPPATSPAPGNLQNLSWLAGSLLIGLAFLLLARKLARQPELKTTTVVSLAPPPADQVIFARPAQNQPYVHIETEASTQTQSQSWRPPPQAGRVVAPLPEAVRAGVMAHLSQWFRQKMVQRLVSDRAQLLATQEAAARKMQTVDQRLAKVERQIRQINQQYEQRIDALLLELDTAKEENRELIRDKIALVKAEMEKARREAGARAKENETQGSLGNL